MITAIEEEQAVSSAKKGCAVFNLPEPKVYKEKPEADEAMGDEIGRFNFKTKETDIHGPNLEKRAGKKHLRTVLLHEFGHHKYCPGDIKNYILQKAAAIRVLEDHDQAGFAQNVFADMIENTQHVMNGEKASFSDLYQRIGKNSKDEFWNFYMRTCEKLWDLPETTLVNNVTENIEADAEQSYELNKDTINDGDAWPEAMEEFSKILKKYLKDKPPGTDANTPDATGDGDEPGGEGEGEDVAGQGAGAGEAAKKKLEERKKILIDSHSAKDFIPYEIKKDDGSEKNPHRGELS